jgi:16S rRNA (guanine(966)-N(2))-methyltransferase RsmD
MRIIQGIYKNYSFKPYKGDNTRPTTERVKEQLFDLLANLINFTEINVLDLFAGTGNIGLEFLSRGAVNVTSIDDGALQSVSAGKEYINLNYPNRHTLIKGNSNIILNNDSFNDSHMKYDIILIDGSFKYDIVKQDIILSKKLAHSDTILIINNVLKNKRWMKYWTEEVSNATAELESSGFITNLHNIDIDVGRGTVICKYV